jgi:hypothetical protein
MRKIEVTDINLSNKLNKKIACIWQIVRKASNNERTRLKPISPCLVSLLIFKEQNVRSNTQFLLKMGEK